MGYIKPNRQMYHLPVKVISKLVVSSWLDSDLFSFSSMVYLFL